MVKQVEMSGLWVITAMMVNAVIEIGRSDEKTPLQMRLTQGQTFPNKFLGRNFSIEQRQKAKPYFLGTESLSIGEMGYLWGNLVLSESESIINQALRGLEPGLERLAFVLDSSFRGASGGHFKVKFDVTNVTHLNFILEETPTVVSGISGKEEID